MKYIVRLIITIALAAGGLAFIAPAAQADDSGFQFTVTSTSHGTPTVSTTLSDTVLATPGGATQVLWQDPDFNGKLTVKAVKTSWQHRIKVIATGSNSSRVIYQKSGHRKLVVLKPKSKVRNTGLHNRLRVGFVWTTTWPAVVKYDKGSHQYRHAANLLTKGQLDALQRSAGSHKYKVVGSFMAGHKRLYIVVWCGNFIGGNVPMIPNVIPVRFQEDLLYNSHALSIAKAEVNFDFSVTCPSTGAHFSASGSAWAYGKAESDISFTERIRASVIGGLEHKALENFTIDQSTEADAQASVQVSGSCGTPPPSYVAPTASGQANACVVAGQNNGVITASGTNPNNVAAPGTLTVGGQSKSFASVGAGSTVTWDFSGFAPGTYNGSFSLGSPINKSASFTVTVNPCPPPPSATVSLDQLNDLDATDPNCVGTPAECQSFTLFQGHVMVPSDVSGTLTVSATYETVKFTGNGTNTMSLGAGSYDPEIKLIAGTELPPTDCTGRPGKCSTVALTFTPTGGGAPVVASTEIRINPPPTPPQ